MKYDRFKFLSALKTLVERFKIKAVNSLPEGTIIIVSRVEDFDPESNSIWKIEANRSYPREGLECSKCHYPVVMSNWGFSEYQKHPNPEHICCNQCILGFPGIKESLEGKEDSIIVTRKKKPTIEEMSKVIPVQVCTCGYQMNRTIAAVHDDLHQDPRDADVSLCAKCSRIWLFNGDGTMRLPTAEEEKELMKEPEIIRARATINMARNFNL